MSKPKKYYHRVNLLLPTDIWDFIQQNMDEDSGAPEADYIRKVLRQKIRSVSINSIVASHKNK